MKIPPYDNYKDSDDNWLPQVPSHWTVNRNKIAFRLSKHIVGNQSSEYQLLSLTLNGIIHRDIESGFGKMPADFGTYQRVEPGDLVFCLFDIDETPRTIGLSQYQGMITGAYAVFKCTESAVPEYIYYFYLHIDSTKGLRPFYTGLRKVVRSETFANIKLPIPPLEEQQTIATFLDHETARIDTLIEKQQKLIVLLREKRQAVISHAVTKGLDPTVPLKESGIEWLGEVPEHWRLIKFSHCASIRNGQVDPRDPPFRDFILIAPNHIESGTGKLMDTETAVAQGADSGKYLCKKGEVIYSKIRPALSKVCISPSDETICSADMYPIHGTNSLRNGYLYWFMLTDNFTAFATLESDRVAMPKINRESLAEIKVLVPPTDEQLEIENHIDSKSKSIDTLVRKSLDVIELLKERRTALISAAVTGKIDVRNHPSAREAA